MNGTAITTLDPPMQKVEHQVTPRELLDLFAVALQFKVPGDNPENAAIVARAHSVLDQQFERGRKHGFQEGYDAACATTRPDAEALFRSLGVKRL